MTTYLGEKAVGIGTVKAEIGVTGVVLHDSTLKGNGNTEPLGVDTEVIATKEDLQNIGAEGCVKKSGDTMTGDLVFDGHGASETGPEIKFVGLGPNPSYGKEYMTTISTFRGAGFNIKTYVDGKSQDVLGFSDGFWGYSHINDKMLNSGAGLYPWKATYTKVLNAGNKVVGDVTSESSGDLIVPSEGGTLARIEDLQNATTALNAEIASKASKETVESLTTAVNDINTVLADKQDKLTAGENITIEDGVISATGGGGELPDNVLVNNATQNGALAIFGTVTGIGYNAVVIGSGTTSGRDSVAIGCDANGGSLGVAIGHLANTSSSSALNNQIAIGASAKINGAITAIQLGSGTNSDDNTFKVANQNGNFEIMSSDGTIPEARLADITNAQQGDVLTLDSAGNAVWQAGGGGGGSYTAGTGIDITNDVISITAPTLKNASPDLDSGLAITNNSSHGQGNFTTVLGIQAYVPSYVGQYSTVVGARATSSSDNGIAIGWNAKTSAKSAIQIGCNWAGTGYENADENTFKVGNDNGNFEMMDANGNVPLDRLTYVTDQIGDISTALTAILGE